MQCASGEVGTLVLELGNEGGCAGPLQARLLSSRQATLSIGTVEMEGQSVIDAVVQVGHWPTNESCASMAEGMVRKVLLQAAGLLLASSRLDCSR